MASFATPDELATRLGATFDSAQQAQAQALLDEASAVIRGLVGQELTEVVDDQVTLVAPAGQWLALPQRPVQEVTSVMLDGAMVDDWTLVGHRLYRCPFWTEPDCPPVTVEVTYTHGHPTDDSALDLAKSYCLALASMGMANPRRVRSEAIDDYRVTFTDADGGVPDRMRRALLDRYRRPSTGSVRVT